VVSYCSIPPSFAERRALGFGEVHMLTDRERLILLNLIPDIGSTQLRRLLDAFGELERVFRASAQELQQVEGLGPALARRIVSCCQDERMLKSELTLAKQHGVEILTLEDAAYPKLLRTIHDPPLALYIRGTLTPADEVAVGIVGSRRASLYGLQSAEQLSYDLALRGISVVSGLARGIDASAHRGALKASGRTLAILGNGLSSVYPIEHEPLAKQITQHGALISEYPMSMRPWPHNFPRRNRIISGLSLGVVIVEAANRSGALITADCALEQGREVFAVPGPMTAITSQGTHQLVKQGARLVTSANDIVEELHLAPEAAKTSARMSEEGSAAHTVALPKLEERVFACVRRHKPRDIDMIASDSGLATSEVAALLLQLELKRLVQQRPGKQFVRSE
jgi:DNA processing protein